MKWTIPQAEPIIEDLIQRYIDMMDVHAVRGKNRFDIGTVHHDHENVILFKLNPQQTHHVAGDVHEMLNVRDFGSMEFRLTTNAHVKKVKVYQELVHDVISVIHKAALDDMPVTMRTIKTRHQQMLTLLRHWERMTPRTQRSRLTGTRMEITIVGVDKVLEARVLCDTLDILRWHPQRFGRPHRNKCDPNSATYRGFQISSSKVRTYLKPSKRYNTFH